MNNRILFALITLASIVTLSTNQASAQESSAVSRKIVAKVAPQYPSLARSMHLQGSVRTEVLVAPDGKVRSVEVKGGHPVLAQAVQEAVRRWTWEPAPRETRENVEFKFTP